MTIQAGQIITIGTAKFIIDDIRDGHRVGDVVLRYTLREGFIKLNGATVLREDYPRLVQWVDDNNLWTEDESALGLFGVGDGLITMRLPDFRNRFIEGVDSNGGVVVEAGLPEVTLTNTLRGKNDTLPYAMQAGWYDTSTQQSSTNVFDNAIRRSNVINDYKLIANDPIYGNSNTVQPAAIRLIAQIKY